MTQFTLQSHKFLQTSQSLKSIHAVINSENYYNELFEELIKTGILINIDKFSSKTLLFKKNNSVLDEDIIF
ncbi:hypothetical protein FHR29_002024 [Sphingobacterium sp. JUb56]|nr:hypothetical protein [Sphingobacterium sp. JUb56]